MKPTLPFLLLGALSASCAHQHTPKTPPLPCSPAPMHAARAPGVSEALNHAETWLTHQGEASASKRLLSPEAIAALNVRNLEAKRAAYQDVRAPEVANSERVAAEFAERIAWLDAKLASGTYHEARPGSYAEAKARIASSTPVDQLQIIAKEADIRCVPMTEGLFTSPPDLAFDRNRCSRAHIGEVVRVLGSADEGAWRYVHVGHSVGWVHRATLSTPGDIASLNAHLGEGPYAVVTDDMEVDGLPLRMGRRFPAERHTDGSWSLEIPTEAGSRKITLPSDAPLHMGAMPFTRANLFRLAFERLGEPYGWGGYRGGRDCSRLLLDLFSVFGIQLGRHSLVQAEAGSRSIDLEGLSPSDKRRALRKAGESGIVLVYMPGHIMLHLGEVDARPYALSSISEFLTPCSDGDQVVRLDRVSVSDYTLGRHTERSAFIERITKLAIFGGP